MPTPSAHVDPSPRPHNHPQRDKCQPSVQPFSNVELVAFSHHRLDASGCQGCLLLQLTDAGVQDTLVTQIVDRPARGLPVAREKVVCGTADEENAALRVEDEGCCHETAVLVAVCAVPLGQRHGVGRETIVECERRVLSGHCSSVFSQQSKVMVLDCAMSR